MPVLINQKQYLPDFIRLNEDWIAHYISIEEAARELAHNPTKIMSEAIPSLPRWKKSDHWRICAVQGGCQYVPVGQSACYNHPTIPMNLRNYINSRVGR